MPQFVPFYFFNQMALTIWVIASILTALSLYYLPAILELKVVRMYLVK